MLGEFVVGLTAPPELGCAGLDSSRRVEAARSSLSYNMNYCPVFFFLPEPKIDLS
ncbi:MAG: hypothetical protein JWO80_3903 [Bryobacterales bacterium]|nr:hypothetical protein [Bryobacterales bacterium]